MLTKDEVFMVRQGLRNLSDLINHDLAKAEKKTALRRCFLRIYVKKIGLLIRKLGID